MADSGCHRADREGRTTAVPPGSPLAWLLSKKVVTSIIIERSGLIGLRDNLAAVELEAQRRGVADARCR